MKYFQKNQIERLIEGIIFFIIKAGNFIWMIINFLAQV